MAQGHGQPQLHFHAPGVILKAFLFRQGKRFQAFLIAPAVPVFVGKGHDFSHLPGVEAAGHAHLVKYHANVLLGKGEILPVVFAQDGDAASVPMDHVQNQTDGGGFSGAVFSDQSQNAAAGQGQGQVIQRKIRIVFGQIFDFQCIHACSSNAKRTISSTSSPLRPLSAARRRASSRCHSIFFRCSSRSSSIFRGAT